MNAPTLLAPRLAGFEPRHDLTRFNVDQRSGGNVSKRIFHEEGNTHA